MEAWTNFIFVGSKIVMDKDCSREIKRCLLLGRKDKPRQNIKKQDITLPTKVYIVKAMIFPIVTYGCENWTMTKAEYQRINAFEL